MSAELRVTDRHWAELRKHLLEDGAEHAAVLLCGTVTVANQIILMTRRVIPLHDADLLDSSPLHLSISPVTLARVAKQARLQAATIVLCHSHPWAGPVHPSPLDRTPKRTSAAEC